MNTTGEKIDEKFARVKELLEQQIRDGLHPGAQLCVAIDGGIVADFGVGETEVGTGIPVTNNTVMPLFSSAKPITAVAIGVLVDSGRMNLEDTVATHIPEFAAHGKSTIEVRHLMNHTSGLSDDALADSGRDRTEIIARLCDSVPLENWKPGERSAYLPTSSWHLLGELVERVSGSSFSSFIQEFVLNSLEMNDTYPNVDTRLAEALGEQRALMHVSGRRAIAVEPDYAPERQGRLVRPGSSFHGPAHDVVKMYAMLLAGGLNARGERVLESETVTTLTARQHEGLLDETFGVVMDRGLGFFIDSQRHGPAVPYGYGTAASPDTFGHGGKESSTGFADPARGLAVSLIFNGMPGEPQHDRRLKQTFAAVYDAVE